MAKRNHVHKLRLHKYRNGTEVFFCVEDCDYKIGRELALGKLTICHRCGEPFQLNQYSLNLVKPHCEACHVRKGDRMPNTSAHKVNSKFVKPKPIVEQVIVDSAKRVESDLMSRLNSAVADSTAAEPSEIKTDVEMRKEEDYL